MTLAIDLIQKIPSGWPRILGFSLGCGLLASSIPLGKAKMNFFFGLGMPLLLALLIATFVI